MVVVVGAVVAVVALGLIGLSVYALLGPGGLSGSNGYLFGSLVFAGLVLTIMYGVSDLGQLRDASQRRQF